jgi:putative pyruvate formate lyase activating enzyme
VVPFALEGLMEAARNGFSLPVVYNSSGYDGLETLRLLEGVVDVWLPDLRYSDEETARELSGAAGYVGASRAAVLEMARQVGTDNVMDGEGTIRRGMVVRLLVLPNDLAGVRETLRFLRDEIGTGLRIALMAQYYPTHDAGRHELLSRGASQGEYLRIVEFAERLGFQNALVQDLEASSFYRPDFQHPSAGEPFADASRFGTS